MKRIIVVLVVVITGCSGQKETALTQTTATEQTQTVVSRTESSATTSAATATSPPEHNAEDLVGLASGAIVVQKPEASEALSESWYLFDEDKTTGWTSQTGKFNQPTVVELADRSVLKSVQFDTGNDEFDGRVPKEVEIEISDSSASDGFKPIADVTLSPNLTDGQTFPTSQQIPGRWVRMTIKSMQTTNQIAQLMEFRAYGDRLTHSAAPDVTGAYGEEGSMFHLKQEGTTVTGCYDRGTAPLQGGMEGRLLRFTWNMENDSGPAIAIFGDGGYMFVGHWQTNSTVTEHPVMEAFEAKKKGADPGNCALWKPPQDQMGAELKKTGRVRLYGINFDSDSDVIRGESRPTLDQVAAMMKGNPDLKIMIEGHTDSTATAEHNRELSEKRANAVRLNLVTAGIEAGRLVAAGFGSTKPVATNDTPLGRAANRRVELVRQ